MNILDKNKTSSWMMRFAWTLEVILCISGMLIAFTLSYIGVTGESQILTLDTKLILLVGTLPLIGVALTELLKIPLVTGFMYAKSWMIKGIAGVALTAICILTFETMLTGQEQLFSLRAEQIKIQKQDENRMIEQIQLFDNQIASISGLSPAEIKKEANAGIQAQLTAINEQIDDLRTREESLITSNNSAEVSELLRQVKQLEDTKKTLIDNHRTNLKEINNEKLSLNSDEQNELENAGLFRKGSVENKFIQRDLKKFYTENLQLRSTKVPGYESWYVKDSVYKQLEEIFPGNFTAIAQLIDTRLNGQIHKDGKRKYALNYLIDSGGEDVYTCVYNEDKQMVKKIKQEVGDWVILDTQRYHSVENITSTRITLSVSLDNLDKEQEEWLNAKI